jgi:hypothetical protein
MVRILFALLSLAAATQAAAIDRRYPVADFDRVIVEGPYVVTLVTGRPSSAAASGTREGLDRVTIDVQGQTLRIRRNRQAWGGNAGADNGTVTITLATRNIRSVRTIGPTRFDLNGARGLNVELSVEGSGRLHAVGVAADNLSLGLLGAGALDISGTANVLRADSQGTGTIEGSHLVAHSATLTTTSTGTIALTVNGPATVAANGLGDVTILGHSNCTVSGAGSAQVRCAASDQR